MHPSAAAVNGRGSSSSGASSSSSQRSPSRRRPSPHQQGPHHQSAAADDDDRDEVDLLGDDVADGEILDDDPLSSDLRETLSSKRKQRQRNLSHPARFLSNLAGTLHEATRSGRATSLSPVLPSASALPFGNRETNNDNTGHGLPGWNLPRRNGGAVPPHADSGKDDESLDWYVEGPGRRVGYEDLTAIDWIFEYTKERTRLRVLSTSATGLLGYLQQFLDASQVWVILVLTGLVVGAVAAMIDVTTAWLSDLKAGYCSSGPDGGAFYLSRPFCCLGYDEGAKCLGWQPWSTALGISSTGGKWVIEYFFHILFSVRVLRSPNELLISTSPLS